MQEELENGGLTEFQTPEEKDSRPRTQIRGFAVAAVLFLLDIALKHYATTYKPDIGPDWASFRLFLNEGIVFSLPVPNPVYLPIVSVVFLIFAFAAIRMHLKEKQIPTWILLVTLGAFSNLLDRFIHSATVDYLIFFNMSAINLADIMIVAGVLLFLKNQK
jgi:lipoprotein signal peptidase